MPKDLRVADQGGCMYKTLRALALLVAGILVNSNALADELFNYSYNFGDGYGVFGSFSGHRQANFIADISAITINFGCTAPGNGCSWGNSVPNTLPVVGMAWNYDTHFWDKSLAPVVSFDGTQNNFLFINQPSYPPSFDSATLTYFQMYTMDPGYPFLNPSVTGVDPTTHAGDSSLSINPAGWSVTPVPEPEIYSMLLSGLGLLGFAGRRRHQRGSKERMALAPLGAR
ncbi:PEP-CTERM sorting domain-containing protein [Alphaproteobacteria bacterium]|nr:PEP-CTERM sorting domain-containing protein [Alphaproteobacteria bacterium]